jgi:hypothetical protein
MVQEPLKVDLVISFPEHGFHLRFEPRSQRLRLIEVFDVQRLQMRYATSSIGGPSVAATFVAVYALFGPTFPGTYNTKRCIYTLFYPGLSFAFPIPAQYTECCQHREGKSFTFPYLTSPLMINLGLSVNMVHCWAAELPLEFPDGTTPVMSRVCIYDSAVGGGVGVGAPLKIALPPQLPLGSLYMEEVHAKLAEELWFTGGGQHLPFGASPQDVWAELGRPCGIHQKQVDPMVIHSASDPRPRTALCGDYFYNYFARGIDILFDGQTHRIKKFVLHTNFPGHTDFNCYIKCNFFIHVPPAGENGEELDKAPTAYGNGLQRCISADTTWSQVQVLNNLLHGFTAGTLFRCAWHWLLSSSYHHCLTVAFGHTFTKFSLMEGGTSNCNLEIFSCLDCQCQYVTSKCTLMSGCVLKS